jgi:uncharacterized FlaG/YvyC family protein
MEVGDIHPVRSTERTATATRQSNENSGRKVQLKSRGQFKRDFDEDEGVVYRVVDEETGIILAQVPSEEVVRVAKRLQQMLAERANKCPLI